MSTNIARWGAAILATAALLASGSTWADNEVVSIAQATDGTIVATLSGTFFPCSFFVQDPAAVSSSGTSYTVTSTVVALGCPPTPGASTVPYSRSVNLGIVPDGTHTVTWNFTGALGGSFGASFVMVAGGLNGARKVPALGPFAMAALLMLLAASALRYAAQPRSEDRRA